MLCDDFGSSLNAPVRGRLAAMEGCCSLIANFLLRYLAKQSGEGRNQKRSKGEY